MRDPVVAASLAQLIGELQVGIDGVVREAQRPLWEDLPGSCDAAAVVAARLACWTPLAEDQGRLAVGDLPDRRLDVTLSALELQDVVDILIDNVLAHTPEGVGFTVRLEPRIPISWCWRSRTRGSAFAPEPGPPGLGSIGQGLRIARRIIEEAGGTLTTSEPGGPAAVRVTLPRAAGSPSRGTL